MRMKVFLRSKSSRPQDELSRSGPLQERICRLYEQRQTVEGPLPRLQGHAKASLHFTDHSVVRCSRDMSLFSGLSHCSAIQRAFFFWREAKPRIRLTERRIE